MADFHSVGSMFKNKSKAGNDYFTIKLFQSSNKDNNVNILAFEKKSKGGNTYWSLSIPGEGTLKEKLEKLNDEMKRHLVAHEDKDSTDENQMILDS